MKNQNRSSVIKRIKTLQSVAGISNESHLANIAEISKGRAMSCTQLTPAEMQTLIGRYQKIAPKEELPSQLKFIYSLWLQLCKAGCVENGSRQACRNFCEKFDFMDGEKLPNSSQHWSKIIEMLKKMLNESAHQEVCNG